MMSKYSQYFAIEKQLKSRGYDIERAELVDQFTNGSKYGLSSLTAWEYKEFLKWLNTNFINQQKRPHWQGTPEDKKRKKLIQLFVHEMGYTIKGLNQWCIKYGQFHKPLNSHSSAELSKLIVVAEKIYVEFMKKVTG